MQPSLLFPSQWSLGCRYTHSLCNDRHFRRALFVSSDLSAKLSTSLVVTFTCWAPLIAHLFFNCFQQCPGCINCATLWSDSIQVGIFFSCLFEFCSDPKRPLLSCLYPWFSLVKSLACGFVPYSSFGGAIVFESSLRPEFSHTLFQINRELWGKA